MAVLPLAFLCPSVPLSTTSVLHRSECRTATNSAIRLIRFQNPLTALLPLARVQRIAQPIAQQIEGEHSQDQGNAGKEDQMGGSEHLVAFLADHRTPFWSGRLRSQSQKGERSGIEDGGGHPQGARHHEG